VEIGNTAFKKIGEEKCLDCLLNSPGNFTASKLAWVKEKEPQLFKRVDKMMLPGDFIAMKLTGEITTTPSALSEGILWDFRKEQLSKDVMQYYGFGESLIPKTQNVFSIHGTIKKKVAEELSLAKNTVVSYKAGDQLNNALSLNVLRPGEVAATAGTSGVIYAVTDQLFYDRYSRVNAFAHVNYSDEVKNLGVLLCINGAGSMNRWVKQVCGDEMRYTELDQLAAPVAEGSDGLCVLPFGNGAERMLQNRMVNAQILNLDLNKHTKGHLIRAAQEGIAFAFRYGLDIMRETNLHPSVIRAGKANMFLSDVFMHSFVNATGVAVELYNNDGSVGAALGAGIGAGVYKKYEEAFSNFKPLERVEPTNKEVYDLFYNRWKEELEQRLANDL
jgi:xylulokinase